MGRSPRALVRAPAPTLALERELFDSGFNVVGGIDEVGRGAWAGPLYVGVVVIDRRCGSAPEGTRDSKALSAQQRRALRPELERWCAGWGIGVAQAREIDEVGLTTAQRRAAARALRSLPIAPDALIVDGSWDFVTPKRVRLPQVKVRTVVRADARCATVAAASVLAKVARDALMMRLSRRYPGYRLDEHKGYCTRAHAAAVDARGLTDLHRRSWSIDELGAGDEVPERLERPTAGCSGEPLVAEGFSAPL